MKVDITDQTSMIQSDQKEATQNIKDASWFDLSPDIYKEQKEDFKPELDKATKYPVFATRGVAQAMAESSEHAAAIAPDAEKLSWIENTWNKFTQGFENMAETDKAVAEVGGQELTKAKQAISAKTGPQAELTDLNFKRLNGGKLTEHEEMTRFGLEAELSGQDNGMFQDAVASVVDQVAGVARNKELMIGVTGGTAVVGGTAAVGAAAALGVAPAALAAPLVAAAAATGYLAVSAYDQFKQTSAASYADLSELTAPGGTPLNLDHETKRNIAYGVGVVAGAVEYVGDKIGLGAIPFIKNFSKNMAEGTVDAGLKYGLIQLGKTVGANYAEEFTQGYVEIIGQEIGKVDPKNTQEFVNGLLNGIAAINEKDAKTGNRENLRALNREGMVGALAGAGTFVAIQGTATVVKSAVANNTDITGRKGTPIQQSRQIVEFRQMLQDVANVSKDTELGKIDPEQLAEIRNKVISKGEVWFSDEDIAAMPDEQATMMRDLLDKTGIASQALNAPKSADMHAFLPLLDKYPTLADHVRLHPEGPSANSVEVHIEKMVEADEKRMALQEKLKAEGITPEQKTEIEAQLSNEEASNDVWGEDDYMKGDTFTQEIEGVLPAKEVAHYNDAQRKAREAVVAAHDEAANLEMNQIAFDTVLPEIEAIEQAEQEAKLENSPYVAIVDRYYDTNPSFRQSQRFQTTDDLTATHHQNKKGKKYSPFAIDPRSLTEEQKTKYAKNPRMHKHGAFVKGGISPDVAAQLLGVKDGETLLYILSETDNIKETAKNRVDSRKEDNIRKAQESVNLNKTALAKAYNDKTKNHIEEMKVLLRDSWGQVKKGFKRIALPLPTIDSLRADATKYIDSSKLSDLSPNRWKVGERKSQRNAVNAILKNDTLNAFIQKQAAALNSEMTRATHIAIGQVNRALKVFKKLNSKSTQAMLKEAGPEYVNAIAEIQDVYNLNPRQKGQSKRDAYMKFAKKMIGMGQADLTIPDKFTDVRESVRELSVEEVLLLENRVRGILHLAKMKNRLYNEFGDPAKQLQTIEALNDSWVNKLKDHPDYDPKKAIEAQGSLSGGQNSTAWYQNLEAKIKNAEHILLHADNDLIGGDLNTTIFGMIKGRGKYQGQGASGKANDMIALKKQFEKIIEKFGKKEWQSMQNEEVFVKDFETIAKLNNGKLRRSDLFVMMLNMGNEGNRTRLAEGFGVDIAVIESVLETEMTEKHATAMQAILDTYASYFPRVQKLHSEMNGTDVQFVEARPYTHKGKVYPGGYYKISYQSEMNVKKIEKKFKKMKDVLLGKEEFSMAGHFYADDMTKHGHTEQRSEGTEQAINLNMNSIGAGFETVVHDLNYRKPIADALKILMHKPDEGVSVFDALASVVGINDALVVINTVVEAAGSVQMENNRLFDSNEALDMMGNMLKAGASAGYLVYRSGTMFIQPASLTFAIKDMGLKGSMHVGNTLKVAVSNPKHIGKIYELAAEINPVIRNNLADIDENSRDPVSKQMGKRYKFLPKSLQPIDKMRETSVEFGYKGLAFMDQWQKVLITVSAYSQFLAGDADGFSYDQVMAMSRTERDHMAKAYANQLSALNLTAGAQEDKAEMQKRLPLWTMFFNDARNQLNTVIRSRRKIRQSLTNEEQSYLKRGTEASRHAAVITATLGISSLWLAMMRDEELPELDEPTDWAAWLGKSVVGATFGATPGTRDIWYAINYEEKYGRDKTVAPPVIGGMENIKDTLQVASDFMDIVRGDRDISRKEAKAMAFTFSYFMPIPVTALFKAADVIEKSDLVDDVTDQFRPSMIGEFSEKVDKFVKENEEASEEDQINEAYIEALKQLKDEVAPDDTLRADMDKDDFTENDLDIIKEIESGGRWDAQNPNGSAAGLYQFIEKTWLALMEEAPELGLTENGRVSKNPDQQERAMRYFTKQNIRKLKANDIPINTETIYAAHFLGSAGAVQVLGADNGDKLKSLVAKRVMTDNYFKSSMTVADFKEWLTEKVDTGRESLGTKGPMIAKD